MAALRPPSHGRPLGLAILLGLAPSAVAAPGDGTLWFDGTLAEAERAAADRNAPLIVCCAQEDEEASERFLVQLRDPVELEAHVDDAVFVVVNDGRHETTTIQVKGERGKREKREVCSVLHTASCEVHRRNWDAVYQRFVTGPLDGRWQLPEAIVVAPDGEIRSRLGLGEPPSGSEIVSEIQRIRRLIGPAMARDGLPRARALLRTAREGAERGQLGATWRAWKELGELAPAGALADEATAGVAAAEAGMEQRLATEEGRLDSANAVEVYRALALFYRECRGAPIERATAKCLARIEKRKETREEVLAVKRELEAEDLLEEARARLAEGEESSAKRLLKRIVSRYKETPAAEEARRLLGE